MSFRIFLVLVIVLISSGCASTVCSGERDRIKQLETYTQNSHNILKEFQERAAEGTLDSYVITFGTYGVSLMMKDMKEYTIRFRPDEKDGFLQYYMPSCYTTKLDLQPDGSKYVSAVELAPDLWVVRYQVPKGKPHKSGYIRFLACGKRYVVLIRKKSDKVVVPF